MKMNVVGIICAIIALIISFLIYYFKIYQIASTYLSPNHEESHQNDFAIFSENDSVLLIKKWEKNIFSESKKFESVIVGLNANLDLIISVPNFLSLNNIKITETTKESDHIILNDIASLKESLIYHMRHGSAAERMFTDKALFDDLVSHCINSDVKEVAIGGNAALIAQTMRSLCPNDVHLELVGPVGPKLKNLLHTNISVSEDCLDSYDEVHVILEYSRGDQLCSQCAKAPVANRFIFSHDQSNSGLSKLDKLFELSKSADLLVLSGLHLTEVMPVSDWKVKLEVLHRDLKASSVYSHLELASMTDLFRLNDIANHVLPLVYSLGLNEQELQFLSQSYAGPHVSLTSKSSKPEVSKVVDTLQWLLTNKTGTRLSRIHFHCLTYHIIAVRVDDRNKQALTFPSLSSAVSAAARSAGTRACDIPIPDPTLQEIRMESRVVRLGSSGPEHVFDTETTDSWVVTWKTVCHGCKEIHNEIRFALSPVLVCRNPSKTVGLGDSISATGLLHTPKFL